MRTVRLTNVHASVATRCQHRSSSEQVWTGLQFWSLDVTRRGQCWEQGVPVQWGPMLGEGLEGYGASLYGEIQCIMGNCEMGPPHEQTNR